MSSWKARRFQASLHSQTHNEEDVVCVCVDPRVDGLGIVIGRGGSLFEGGRVLDLFVLYFP